MKFTVIALIAAVYSLPAPGGNSGPDSGNWKGLGSRPTRNPDSDFFTVGSRQPCRIHDTC
jgi:hypothetical protein